MEEYIEARQKNLEAGSRNPYFVQLLGATDRVYRSAINLKLMTIEPTYAKLLMICHRSLLSAAALIAQSQPDDSVAITRRAIETARTALAIKLNPENSKRWLAYEARHERWLRRQEGGMPKHPTVQFVEVQTDPLVKTLDESLGILSDAYVHFTPEYYSSLDWEVRRLDDNNGEIVLNYFERRYREIERHYIMLAGNHCKILEAFDRCFDGAFMKDEATRLNIAKMWEIGKEFAEEYRAKYAEGSVMEESGVF